MKKSLMILPMFLLYGFAFASPSASPLQMRKQHNAMSLTNKQWAVCKKSLRAGDFAAAGASLERMQKATKDLEKFKLHKNSEMMGNFKGQTRNFKTNLAELGKAIKEKDQARTQTLSLMIDNSCVQCHSVFR